MYSAEKVLESHTVAAAALEESHSRDISLHTWSYILLAYFISSDYNI